MAELPATEADDRYGIATGYAMMLARAAIHFISRGNESLAREFLRWTFRHLIERKAQFRSDLLDSTAEYMKELLGDMVPKDLAQPESLAMLATIQRLVRNLPKTLNMRLGRDADFMARLGLKSIFVGEAGPLRFEQRDYALALTDAINGRTAEARILGTGASAHFTLRDSTHWAVDVDGSPTARVTVSGPLVGLLSGSPEQREKAATDLGPQIDLPPKGLRAIIAELAATEDNETRLRRADELLKRSATSYYGKLEAKINAGRGVSEPDLFPDTPECLLRHLRLDFAGDHGNITDGLTEEMTEVPMTEGGLAILARLLRLPCPLSSTLKTALTDLSREDRRTVSKLLLGLPRTPLTGIHLAGIFLGIFGDDRLYRRLGRGILHQAVKDLPMLHQYLAFIRWSLNRVTASEESSGWAVETRLAVAWAHGDRVFGILRAANYDLNEFTRHLGLTPARLQTLFADSDASADDVANPINLDAEVFAISGIAYAWGEMAPDDPLLRGYISSHLVVKGEGQTLFPALGLLVSTTTAKNRIASIFGGDRVSLLERWLSPEACRAIRTTLGTAPDEQMIAALDSGRCDLWVSAPAVLGHFPIRRELVPGIEKAIFASDFAAKALNDPEVAWIALLAATSLARFLPNRAAVSHLEGQLCGIARSLKLVDVRRESAAIALLESVLNIVRLEPNIASGINKFGQLMARLALECPFLGKTIRPFVQRLCEELPLEKTIELWRLNCRLRTQG